MSRVKLAIDPDLCAGHGRCFQLAPGMFADDERGYGQVIGDGTVEPGQMESARRAVTSCPELAISLVEDES